jgi:predicted O-methyltransferase YrrM
MLISLRNTIAFATKLGNGRILLNKVISRLFDEKGSLSSEENAKWLNQNATDFSELAQSIDPKIWEETIEVTGTLRSKSEEILSKMDLVLGGGGFIELIYFLTRVRKPKVIVETGVAAGYSSQVFLMAISRNGSGRLFSSDFPYFRLQNPEQFIGILVDDAFREAWQLFIKGDENNLDQICSKVSKIDFFHYDSDKRYRGRKRAYEKIKTRLSNNAIVIFDDIQDNSFFYDLTINEEIPEEKWKVFLYGGKYIGYLEY